MTNNHTFVLILGFILFFIGWLNIITGVVIIVTSEDKIFFGFGAETMIVEIFDVSKEDQVFHGMLRIIIGVIIIVIGNSLISERHIMFRPDLRDCKFCVDRFRK